LLENQQVDILFANEAEITTLFGVTDFEEAAKRAASTCQVSALTRSEKGSVILSGNERYTIAASAVSQVLDTTGAGDLYASGFLYGYTHQKPLAECGRLGSLAAAEIISHLGARPEMLLGKLVA
jgi:sugar/nucleoside kinase (ribokinase family)